MALYAEFGFEGAVIANNIVDGAAVGVSVTNFDKGGRLAVVQGNLIRNLLRQQPPGSDPNDTLGIGVEADTVVTGNVIEAPRRRHPGRLGRLSARCCGDRQRRAQRRLRHRGFRRLRRRDGRHRQ